MFAISSIPEKWSLTLRYAAAMSEHYGPVHAPISPRRRANAAASVVAGVLGVVTAGVFVWFAIYCLDYNGPTDQWTDQGWVNVLGGFIGGVWILVAAGFTFARRLGGVWALFAMALLFVILEFLTPLMWGTDFATHMDFVFGFAKTNGVAVGLATIFGFLTMLAAAVAGSKTTTAQRMY